MISKSGVSVTPLLLISACFVVAYSTLPNLLNNVELNCVSDMNYHLDNHFALSTTDLEFSLQGTHIDTAFKFNTTGLEPFDPPVTVLSLIGTNFSASCRIHGNATDVTAICPVPPANVHPVRAIIRLGRPICFGLRDLPYSVVGQEPLVSLPKHANQYGNFIAIKQYYTFLKQSPKPLQLSFSVPSDLTPATTPSEFCSDASLASFQSGSFIVSNDSETHSIWRTNDTDLSIHSLIQSKNREYQPMKCLIPYNATGFLQLLRNKMNKNQKVSIGIIGDASMRLIFNRIQNLDGSESSAVELESFPVSLTETKNAFLAYYSPPPVTFYQEKYLRAALDHDMRRFMKIQPPDILFVQGPFYSSQYRNLSDSDPFSVFSRRLFTYKALQHNAKIVYVSTVIPDNIVNPQHRLSPLFHLQNNSYRSFLTDFPTSHVLDLFPLSLADRLGEGNSFLLSEDAIHAATNLLLLVANHVLHDLTPQQCFNFSKELKNEDADSEPSEPRPFEPEQHHISSQGSESSDYSLLIFAIILFVAATLFFLHTRRGWQEMVSFSSSLARRRALSDSVGRRLSNLANEADLHPSLPPI